MGSSQRLSTPLPMRKLRLRKLKGLALVPTATERQSLSLEHRPARLLSLCPFSRPHSCQGAFLELLDEDIKLARVEITLRLQGFSFCRASHLGRRSFLSSRGGPLRRVGTSWQRGHWRVLLCARAPVKVWGVYTWFCEYVCE